MTVQTPRKRRLPLYIVIALFVIVGGVFLIRSFAASPLISFEGESASLSGKVSIGSDSSPLVSGGKYIVFGQ